MTEDDRYRRLAEAGRRGGLKGGPKGGDTRMRQMTPAERSAFARAGARARWDGKPAIHQVIRQMLEEISLTGRPRVLYVQGQTAWHAEPGTGADVWLQYLVGTYSVGASFTQVMMDVVAG